MLTEVIKRIAESDEVMASGDSVLRGVLSAAAAAYPGWDYEVKKEKMVFDTLNMCEFDIKRHVFVAEGWVPKRDVDKVRRPPARRSPAPSPTPHPAPPISPAVSPPLPPLARSTPPSTR